MQHLTLEQCIKLKELGLPQSTYWYHFRTSKPGDNKEFEIGNWSDMCNLSYGYMDGEEHYSCPDFEELLEWLQVYVFGFTKKARGNDDGTVTYWWQLYSNAATIKYPIVGNTLTDTLFNLAVALES